MSVRFILYPLTMGSTPSPLYTGERFHCHMLEESICDFRGVGSVLSLLFYF